jgi:hypothetical protein
MSNAAIERLLNERRVALEETTEKLLARSEDMEALMRAYASHIEQSLAEAEAKVREVGSFLSQSTQIASRGVQEQFERMRATAGDESARTQDVVRAAYEALSSEMANGMGAAVERFAETVRALREATGDLRQEIDQTRADVKRGIMDLPKETQDATAAMRRVVGDQIRALNELSEIVARHGSVGEAWAPARRVANVAPPRAEPTVAEAPRFASVEAEPLPALAAMPVPAPRRPAAEIARLPTAPAITPRTEAPRPSPQPAQPTAGQGWLRDLLVRASREEEERRAKEVNAARPVAPTVDSVGGVPLDIARAVDHEAAVETWERLRRGERGAFTRRLYTASGQRTFEEIRTKYRQDRDFRASVDRYVADFERLIDEVERKNGSAAAETYLVSDQGKVYTLLAHAAGKFE